MRPKRPSSGPTLPENAGDAEVIRVNLEELEKDVEQGSLARNIALRDRAVGPGDSLRFPRAVERLAVLGAQWRDAWTRRDRDASVAAARNGRGESASALFVSIGVRTFKVRREGRPEGLRYAGIENAID